MRVLIVTHDHPFAAGSGVAAYCQDLETELVGRGYQVSHLFSAQRSGAMVPSLRWSTHHGIAFASLVNSPCPPLLASEQPLRDCTHPRVEALFAECLTRTDPDIVHVHALQGFSGSIIALAKRRGIPVVLTLHDFWALCARAFLIRPNGDLCSGPDGGMNCARFCADRGPLRRRLYRKLMALLPPGRGTELVRRAAALYLRTLPGSPDVWTPRHTMRQNGPGHPADVLAHGGRTAFLLRMVCEADAILAVSNFVKEIFVRHGVSAERVQVLRLGLHLPATAGRRPRQAHDPVRLGFLGRVVPLKGAHILAQAVRLVPPGRARVIFFGPASRENVADLQRMAGGTPLEFRGPYRREELPTILEELDVIVVPTLAQETVGLTVLEAQAGGLPVIASRTGAIPEHVQDGHNGLLFAPGNADDLRAQLLRLLEAPSLVAAMSARTAPPASIGRHVDALTEIYQRCTQGRSRAHASQRP